MSQIFKGLDELKARYPHLIETPERREQRLRREAEREAHVEEVRDVALYAIQDGVDSAEMVECISRYSSLLSSVPRLPGLLELLDEAPPDVFWKTLETEWCRCDFTWPYRRQILGLMRRQRGHAPAGPFNSADELVVFRGCARRRVRGLSWTLDRAVAEKFASKLRGDILPDRVVVSAHIRPSNIFLYLEERKEREVLLDPERLTKLEITPWSAGSD
jgi:hypothetical protein